ncbi:MAG: CpXC domain-containing protein [Anaerolineae bacterium]|nr:CpXC domain-containing protein [Anaerolineae bacterium]
MVQSLGTQITCPNCRQPFTAPIEQLIDVGRDPQAKARLLAGRTNVAICPHCGYQVALSTPLVYHDPAKELLLLYVPMELGLPKAEQERIIGNLTKAVMNSLPADQRKGYLLTPKTMLTMQGMVETILEADGVTKEMLEAQRAKLRLVETFLQVDPEQLPDLIHEHDDKIDEEFFAMMAATAESAIAGGRRDIAEQILALREQILQLSTVGQELIQEAGQQEETIQKVANRLNALGEQATHDDFIDATLELAADGSDQTLQALVGLARPVMDYQFFQILSNRMDQATGDEKTQIASVRDRLLELTNIVDQQNQAVVQQAADTLRGILTSSDMDQAIRERIELLDDTFLAVLSANIQNAEQTKDLMSAARLRSVFDKVVSILQENAPPVIQFINELMQQQNFDDARAKLDARAAEFGPDLLQWIDMLSQDLASRGNNMALNRLMQLREAAVQALAVAGMQADPGDGAQPVNPFQRNAQMQPQRAPEPEPPAESGEERKSGIILPFSSRKRSRKE